MLIPGAFLAVPNDDDSLVAIGNKFAEQLLPDGTRKFLADGAASGWEHRELAVSQDVELAPNVYGRRLVFVNVDTGAVRDSGIDPAQLPGYNPQVCHANGHTVSSRPGQHYLDGQAIPTEPGAGNIEQFAGEYILYPVQAANGEYTFVVRNVPFGVDVHRVPGKLANARMDILSDGAWLSWNLNGYMAVLAPDGRRFDGPAGEGRGFLSEEPGQVFAWTVTNEGFTPIVLKRPLNEFTGPSPAVVTDDVGAVGITYRQRPEGTKVYGYSDGELRGLLGAKVIPFDAARRVFVRAAPAGPAPLNIPRWTGDLPAVWILTNNDEVRAPGNATWSEREGEPVDQDPRPCAEAIVEWPLAPGRPLLCDKWSTEAAGGGMVTMPGHLAAVKQYANPAIEIHCDSPAHEPLALEARQACLDAGVTPILMAHAVVDAAELRAQVARFAPLGKWGITINGRTFSKDRAKFTECLKTAVELWQSVPGCQMISMFGWLDTEPEVQQWFAELVAATPTPAQLPGWVQPVTTPVTPTPPVVIPMPTVPRIPWNRTIAESEIERRRQEREAMGRAS